MEIGEKGKGGKLQGDVPIYERSDFSLSASNPKHSNSKKQKRKTSHCEVLLPEISARLVPSPLRYSGPVIRF